MSDAGMAEYEAELAVTDRRAYFEQRLFVLSPLGDMPTALLIFAILLGSFLALAWGANFVLFARGVNGLTPLAPMRTAFALSVTLSAALFIQRYTRVRERADYRAFADTLSLGAIERHNVISLTPGAARLVPATLLGLFGGLLISAALYREYLFSPGIFAWFLVVTTILFTAFARGVELSRTGTLGANNVIAQDLQVDLLRIDRLSVWGRSAARFSLIWFTVGAVSCLFILDSGFNFFTVAQLVTFLLLGVWVFLRTMQPVHKKIRATKAVELERVRSEIQSARLTAASDAGAATRMQGLLAYESRIEAAPEWPFDQTTLVRVGASALILAVPWFGQAIAGYFIEHLAR
jgi:hypothetical protein